MRYSSARVIERESAIDDGQKPSVQCLHRKKAAAIVSSQPAALASSDEPTRLKMSRMDRIACTPSLGCVDGTPEEALMARHLLCGTRMSGADEHHLPGRLAGARILAAREVSATVAGRPSHC
jgi:hypothetical protein